MAFDKSDRGVTYVHCECNAWPSRRQGLVSNVLRFVGKMASDIPTDTERMFIISYYLSDDTISVYERTTRNLGKNRNITASFI